MTRELKGDVPASIDVRNVDELRWWAKERGCDGGPGARRGFQGWRLARRGEEISSGAGPRAASLHVRLLFTGLGANCVRTRTERIAVCVRSLQR